MTTKLRQLSLLILSMLIGGLISVYLGKELSWDMANYHFYNAYAFLNKRWLIDYWPNSNIHIHFSPTFDFITYFFITYLKPITCVFMIGAIHGLNIWLLYLIANAVINSLHVFPMPRLMALFVTMVGVYGPTVLPGIGSFQHDNLVSLFVLAYVYLHWQYFNDLRGNTSYSKLYWANFLLGLAVGGKLTAGLYVVGGILGYLFIPISFRLRLKLLSYAAFFLLAGFILANGYWVTFLWSQFHNPIYPLMNGIFHSPQFPAYNWNDGRFLPKTLFQAIFFPFYFSFDGRTGDYPFRDFRFAILYAVLAIWLLKRKLKLSLANQWLLSFSVFAFITWEISFSIMRYLAALEMLAPLLIVLLSIQLFKRDWVRQLISVSLLAVIVISTLTAFIVRTPYYKGNYFNVVLPNGIQQGSNAVVLVAYPAFALYTNPLPQTYLIPFLPSSWRYIGIPFVSGEYEITPEVASLIHQNRQHAFYILTSEESISKMYQFAVEQGLTSAGPCEAIKSDRSAVLHQAAYLCRFQF